MPLLPPKNSLDYNPDATILASKKITTIALERMKNPLEDPDFAVLSTLEAQKRLGDSFERFDSLAGKYHSLVLRLGNVLSKDEKSRKAGREAFEDWVRLRTEREQREREGKGRGRKKGGANRATGALELQKKLMEMERRRQMNNNYLDDDASSSSASVSVGEFRRRLDADRDRWRQFYDDDSRNSVATPSSQGNYPYDEADETYIDDEDGGDSLPSARIVPERKFDPTGFQRTDFNSLIFPIIQITREMNSIINSRIKPAVAGLSSVQIKRMNDIYQMVRTSYNDAIFPVGRRARATDPYTRVRNVNIVAVPDERLREDDYEEAIIENNQFGDEILGVWNEDRKSLLLNLTIVINSWKQNTPTGQQSQLPEDVERSYQNTANRLGRKAELVEAGGDVPQGWADTGFNYQNLQDLESVNPNPEDVNPNPEGAGRRRRGRPPKAKKDTMTMTLVGSGRNFYGEQINDSRDIPTIWRSYRDCPTKYLL